MAAALLAGVALRLWEYLGNASLWVDELALSESVLNRSMFDLLVKPLGVGQASPPGFLAAVKVTTMLFGTSELALRLVPLLFTLAGFGLFAAVAWRVLSGGWAAVFATGMFALGTPFFHYGAEMKQYAGDIAIALLLLLVALDLSERPPERGPYRRAALAGAVGAWFSMPSAFVLAGLGVVLLLDALLTPPRRPRPALIATVGVWAAAAITSGVWNLTRPDPRTREFLYGYWFDSFVPIPLRKRSDLLWPLNQLVLFWKWTMGYPWALFLAFVILLGFVMLWRRRRIYAMILAGPLVVTVLASAARFYPFRGRLTLFLCPALLMFTAEGARWVVRGLQRLRVPAPAAASLFIIPPLLAFIDFHPVMRREENRPLFQYLAKRRRPGDAIYIPYDTIRALRYYGPRTGLDPADVLQGKCHHGDLNAILQEIDHFRGRPRVWAIFGHSTLETHEQATMRGYLQTIGRRREGMSLPTVASAEFDMRTELYDLSDPERLASSTADTFPLPLVDPELVRRLSCWPEPRS